MLIDKGFFAVEHVDLAACHRGATRNTQGGNATVLAVRDRGENLERHVTHDVSEAVAMADRVLLIEEKKIGLDLSVDIPRPRRTGSAKLAELEAEVLDRVMKRGDSERAPRLFSHG